MNIISKIDVCLTHICVEFIGIRTVQPEIYSPPACSHWFCNLFLPVTDCRKWVWRLLVKILSLREKNYTKVAELGEKFIMLAIIIHDYVIMWLHRMI